MTTRLSEGLEQNAAVGPQVYRVLRDRIIRGDIAPGARLSEAELAVAYGTSRQPVREAFIKLSEEALVEVRPQRGTFASLISVPAVMTARFIREAVEADIVRIVAQRIDDAGMARLDACIADQHRLGKNSTGDDFMRVDEDFHRCLAEIAGQTEVSDHLEGLKTQMNRVRHISARKFSRARLVAQHEDVVTAIRARNSDQAEAAMRLHLREIVADLPEIVTELPRCFTGASAVETSL
jgi:DNA-binding GntR family transcriptional regulator